MFLNCSTTLPISISRKPISTIRASLRSRYSSTVQTVCVPVPSER